MRKYRLSLAVFGYHVIRTAPMSQDEASGRDKNWRRLYGRDADIRWHECE